MLSSYDPQVFDTAEPLGNFVPPNHPSPFGTPEFTQQSTLEIRTHDTNNLASRDQYPRKPSIRKRDVVDLTLDDEDSIPSPWKKSRSSSQSTEVSTENKDHKLHKVTKPGFKPAFSKPDNPNSRVSSTKSPLSSSHNLKHASAVVVTPTQPSDPECRKKFIENLAVLGKGVHLFNDLDTSSPPTTFKFVRESILGPGVTRTTEEFMSGCSCRKDNGRQIGCEYLSCECLDDSALNNDGKRVFPYAAGRHDFGCLRNFYLERRDHIYECNPLCNCDSNCKNRVVQHGRTVKMQIFKTSNRGWGLRCFQDLKKGQFIDTYRGEIITSEEANKRHQTRTVDQEIYLMDFDKWTEEEGAAGYVCDGMHVGGPTRFINHSCDPNCAIYTVSYNHADISIYELAFFATENIPAFTELTFDYTGKDDQTPISEHQAAEMEKKNGYRPAKCLCGAPGCRGYFFL